MALSGEGKKTLQALFLSASSAGSLVHRGIWPGSLHMEPQGVGSPLQAGGSASALLRVVWPQGKEGEEEKGKGKGKRDKGKGLAAGSQRCSDTRDKGSTRLRLPHMHLRGSRCPHGGLKAQTPLFSIPPGCHLPARHPGERRGPAAPRGPPSPRRPFVLAEEAEGKGEGRAGGRLRRRLP